MKLTTRENMRVIADNIVFMRSKIAGPLQELERAMVAAARDGKYECNVTVYFDDQDTQRAFLDEIERAGYDFKTQPVGAGTCVLVRWPK
jgi:Ni,Fe-hydrogenase I small subunit